MSKLDELSSKMNELFIEHSNSVIGPAYESLVIDVENNKLPLEIFDKYFSPYFFQGVPIPEGANLFETWINIAGTPLSSVDIVDNGEVVFTIPPLYDTSLINLIEEERGVSRVMEQFSLYRDKAPGTVNRFIEDELIPVANKTTSNKDTAISKWEQIANRYRKENTEETKNTSQMNNDDLSYD